MKISNAFGLSVSVLALCVATQAFAQDAVAGAPDPQDDSRAQSDEATVDKDEILVTAERRVSTVQDTAAALTVRSGEELLTQGRYQLEDQLENIPGMSGGAAEDSRASFTSGTDNPASGLVIRGIQSNIGAGGNITSTAAAAALYVDEVYNGLGSNYDLDRIEALRGPQGTLYGRSATSGVVAIHTTVPDLNEFTGDLVAELGDYDLVHLTGGVSIPILTDKVALRVSGNYYDQDSFYADNGGGARESLDGRAKLLIRPTDNFSALLGVAFQDVNTTNIGVSIQAVAPEQYVFTPSEPTPGENSSFQAWGVFQLELGAVALTYIPAYRTFEQTATLSTPPPAPGLNGFSQAITTPDDYFHTQELRLSSRNDSPLQWQVGGVFYENGLEDSNLINDVDPVTGQGVRVAQDTHTKKKTTAVGIFAEGTYSFSDSTRLTAGLRYDHTKLQVDQTFSFQPPPPPGAPPGTPAGPLITTAISGQAGERTYENLNYKLRIEHDLTPDNMLYALASTGASPGDVTWTTNALFQPELIDLDSETLTAFEIGSKNRFLNDRLQLNAAAYYYDYGGYQVSNINVNPLGFPPTFTGIVVPVEAWGLEAEFLARPWAGGRFSLGVDYNKAEYQDIPPASAQYFGFTDIPGVPPFRVNAAYDHTFALGDHTELMLRGEVRYRDEYYPSNALVAVVNSPAFGLIHNDSAFLADLNATLSLADGMISITGYVRNVFDEVYKTQTQVITPPPPAPAIVNVSLSQPRTFGVVAGFRF